MPGPGSSSNGPPCSSCRQLGPAAGGSWQLGHAPRFLSPAVAAQQSVPAVPAVAAVPPPLGDTHHVRLATSYFVSAAMNIKNRIVDTN